MFDNYEKLFNHLRTEDVPAGLFNKIIQKIEYEKEKKHTRKTLFLFLIFFLVSVIITPLSFNIFLIQVKSSGIMYFISEAFADLHTFAALWEDFSLAILESLPVMGLLVLCVSMGVFLFTLRLFLLKRRILIDYFFYHQLGQGI